MATEILRYTQDDRLVLVGQGQQDAMNRVPTTDRLHMKGSRQLVWR